MFPNKKNATKLFFWISAFFARFLTKKKKNWQNPNRSMKFSEIWYVDVSQQRKCYKKTFFYFGVFWPFFDKKTAKIDQNEETWQNPPRLMKFSELWYVEASQQTKCYKKSFFWIPAFFGCFLTKKQAKLTKMKKIGKIHTV